MIWLVSVRKRLLVGNRARESVHESFGHAAHVLAGVFLGQKLVHLRVHVLRPELQRLPLLSCEGSEDFGCIAPSGNDIFRRLGELIFKGEIVSEPML